MAVVPGMVPGASESAVFLAFFGFVRTLSRVFRALNGCVTGREAAEANWLLTATIFRQSLRTRRYTAAPKTSLIYFLSQAVRANARLE